MPLWATTSQAQGQGSTSSQAEQGQDDQASSASASASASKPDAAQIRQEAEHSIATYLIPDSTSSASESILPRDELPLPLQTAIEQRVLTLVDLIRTLRDALTNDEPEVRALAVQLLSLVVTHFSPVQQELAPAASSREKKKSVSFGPSSSTTEAQGSETSSLHLPTPPARPTPSATPSPKPLFDKQTVLTLSTFFSSKLEDGEHVSAELARRYNASLPAQLGSAAGWQRQAQEGGGKLGDKRWGGGTAVARVQRCSPPPSSRSSASSRSIRAA